MADLLVFGQRIKQLRKELGLSQRDFAEKIGVTASALSAYEKGLKNPSVNVAMTMANQFDISLDWLCGLSSKDIFDPTQDIRDALTSIIYLFELRDGHLFSVKESEANHSDSNCFGTLEIQSQVLWNFLKNFSSIYALFDNESIDIMAYDSFVRGITEKTSEDFIKETESERNLATDQLFKLLAQQTHKKAYNR